MTTTITAGPFRRFHDYADGFDFVNNTGARMEAGTKVKVNNMWGVLNGPVEVDASGAAMFLTGKCAVYEYTLAAPATANIEMGTIFTDADGDIMGVYVSDSLKRGKFGDVTDGAAWAVEIGDTSIFVAGLPGIVGSTTTAPTPTPETYVVPEYANTGAIPSPLPATSGADRILDSMVLVATAGAATNLDVVIAGLDESQIGPGYRITFLNTGTGSMTATNAAGNALTAGSGDAVTILWNGTVWRVV